MAVRIKWGLIRACFVAISYFLRKKFVISPCFAFLAAFCAGEASLRFNEDFTSFSFSSTRHTTSSIVEARVESGRHVYLSISLKRQTLRSNFWWGIGFIVDSTARLIKPNKFEKKTQSLTYTLKVPILGLTFDPCTLLLLPHRHQSCVTRHMRSIPATLITQHNLVFGPIFAVFLRIFAIGARIGLVAWIVAHFGAMGGKLIVETANSLNQVVAIWARGAFKIYWVLEIDWRQTLSDDRLNVHLFIATRRTSRLMNALVHWHAGSALAMEVWVQAALAKHHFRDVLFFELEETNFTRVRLIVLRIHQAVYKVV